MRNQRLVSPGHDALFVGVYFANELVFLGIVKKHPYQYIIPNPCFISDTQTKITPSQQISLTLWAAPQLLQQIYYLSQYLHSWINVCLAQNQVQQYHSRERLIILQNIKLKNGWADDSRAGIKSYDLYVSCWRQFLILNSNMAEHAYCERPLMKLTSIKSLREVDSPRSNNDEEPNQPTLTRKLTAPLPGEAEELYLQDLQIQTALEFSIDDLFSKIEKITSEFASSQGRSNSVTSIYNQIEEIVPEDHTGQGVTASSSAELYSFSNYSPFTQNPFRDAEVSSPITPLPEVLPEVLPLTVVETNLPVFSPRELKEASSPLLKPLHQKPEPLCLSEFELGKSVGSGKFGDVFQCRHKRTGALFALKKIFKSTILEYRMVDQFTEELKIHYKLSHPNIVKLYTHFEDQYHVFLLMEYIDGGMLMNYRKSEEKFVSKAMMQVLRAVDYLHRNHIAHRDIKPENIVVTNNTLKICDFGWAANCQTGMKKTFCGTLDYVSPEILEEREYHVTVDLWSLGVLTFQLLAGFPPFQEDIPKLKMNRIKNVDKNTVLYPPQIETEARDFIGRFLKKDPSQRMTLREAYNHPFIRKFNLRERQEVPEDIKNLL